MGRLKQGSCWSLGSLNSSPSKTKTHANQGRFDDILKEWMSQCVPELHKPTCQHRRQSRVSPGLPKQGENQVIKSKQTNQIRKGKDRTLKQLSKKVWMKALVHKYVGIRENYAFWTSSHTKMFFKQLWTGFCKKLKL